MAYLSSSRKLLPNLVLGVVLMGLYHLILWWVPAPPGQTWVNAVDLWVNEAVALIPQGHVVVLSALGLLMAVLLVRDNRKGEPLRGNLLALMLAESLGWALVLFLNLAVVLASFSGILGWLPNQLGPAAEPGFVLSVGLSLGAGFYEELFFRLLLVGGLLWFFKHVPMGLSRGMQMTLVVMGSSLLFAAAHNNPAWGSANYAYAFVFRSVFGALMVLLMHYRGFAITAWTHALYDVCIDVRNAVL